MRLSYRTPEMLPIESAAELLTGGSAEEALSEREDLLIPYEALEKLDPKKRMAVVLHDVQSMTLKEISEHLGIPLQTIASQLRAGRRELAAQRARAHGEGGVRGEEEAI